jgi:hypothetical protein
MMMDVDQAARAIKEARSRRRSRTCSTASISRPVGGLRVNGVRVATWSSRDGWSGDSRPEADWIQ